MISDPLQRIDDLKRAFGKEKPGIQSRTEQVKRKIKVEFRELLGTKG